MAFVYQTTNWNQSFLLKEVRSNPLVQLALSLTRLVLSIISDLICAAFPVLFLRNLQIKMRTKVALCALMGLGVMYDKCSLKNKKPVLCAYNWYSTAACCTVRTVLSGAVTDPDITCQYGPMTSMCLD